MATFADMVKDSYPDAREGVDFDVKTGKDGNLEIGYWNEEKLGPEPDIIRLHSAFMVNRKKRKKLIPTLDDEDPAPWLNAKKEKNGPSEAAVRREIEIRHDIRSDIPLVHIDPETGILKMEGKR